MFTGLIEEVGKVVNIKKSFGSAELEICAENILKDIKIGDSVAINGVCTTITTFSNNIFKVDLSSQTLDVTTFKEIQTGDFVNLERAMQVGERLGGHIVSGHVDFVAEFVKKSEKENSIFLTFEIPENKSKYFIDKGSVTINGISLTIAEKNNNKITVCIIPHTLENTNLKIGQNVNIEIDVIAKYVENFVVSNDNNSSITENFLKENGF